MIIESGLPIFPICPSYGFTSRPDYLVKVVTREGGHEKRDRKWSEPLHYYDGVPVGPRSEEDIEQIAQFFHAMGGWTHRFRFIDYADYRSALFDADLTELDQPFEDLGGGSYQMVKVYETYTAVTDLFETVRTIRHPKGDTVLVANQLGNLQDPSTWTIDEDTGILTITGGFSGTPASWGGEFYVPCRFDGELRVQIQNKRIQALECTLKELRIDEQAA